jgi:cell division protein FtsQ
MRPPAAPRQPRRPEPEPAAPAPERGRGRPPSERSRTEDRSRTGARSGPGVPAGVAAGSGDDSPATADPGRALARRRFVPTGARSVPNQPRGAAAGAVSTGLAARLAEKAAADRRLLLHRLGIALAVLALLAGATWVLLLSPLLALEADKIEITGVGGAVDAAEVRAAVEPEIGTPLLRVDTAAVVDRVASLPAVESTQVSRSWPNGVTVTVVPRVPVAAAALEGGWVLLDDDGVQVTTVPEVPAGLPEVTVPLSTSDETAPALEAVLSVLGALPADLLGQVAQAGATSAEQVTLTLADGAIVRWGGAEENELKVEVLLVLRQQPAGVYDVSVPRSPTTSA